MDIKKSNFKAEVLDSPIPVLVDFWAPWCTPCKMMAPILEDLGKELEGKIKILKVNTEEQENIELAVTYNIQSIPNMKLFKGGQVIKDFVGFRPKDVLRQELQPFLG